MASYNRAILMGNLTRNPEIRYTPSGTAVCDLGLAMNETYKNKAGETVEDAVFVDVVVWGRQAETSAEYLHKGAPVLIEGRLQLDQWEKDGEKRSRIRVRADRVTFLGKPAESTGQGDSGNSKPATSSDPSDEHQDDIPF